MKKTNNFTYNSKDILYIVLQMKKRKRIANGIIIIDNLIDKYFMIYYIQMKEP